MKKILVKFLILSLLFSMFIISSISLFNNYQERNENFMFNLQGKSNPETDFNFSIGDVFKFVMTYPVEMDRFYEIEVIDINSTFFEINEDLNFTASTVWANVSLYIDGMLNKTITDWYCVYNASGLSYLPTNYTVNYDIAAHFEEIPPASLFVLIPIDFHSVAGLWQEMGEHFSSNELGYLFQLTMWSGHEDGHGLIDEDIKTDAYYNHEGICFVQSYYTWNSTLGEWILVSKYEYEYLKIIDEIAFCVEIGTILTYNITFPNFDFKLTRTVEVINITYELTQFFMDYYALGTVIWVNITTYLENGEMDETTSDQYAIYDMYNFFGIEGLQYYPNLNLFEDGGIIEPGSWFLDPSLHFIIPREIDTFLGYLDVMDYDYDHSEVDETDDFHVIFLWTGDELMEGEANGDVLHVLVYNKITMTLVSFEGYTWNSTAGQWEEDITIILLEIEEKEEEDKGLSRELLLLAFMLGILLPLIVISSLILLALIIKTIKTEKET